MKLFFVSLLIATEVVISLEYKTFLSPPVRLKSGQIANTPSDWGPLDWVPGPIAVRYFASDVVDVTGAQISEAEMYVHHWVVYNGYNKQCWGLCPNIYNIFGIGAELRGVSYNFPAPFAIVLTGAEQWTANLHFIRSTNVKDVQECIECRCPDSNPPLHPHGAVNCCIDGTQCWGMENSTLDDPKDYFLKYTIGYEPITKDTIPLTIFSLDVTAKNGEGCLIQYDIPELEEGEINIRKNVFSVQSEWNVTYVYMHQHIGGLNFTIDHYRNGVFIDNLCTSAPVYGNGTSPGNTKGYIESIPPCLHPEIYQLFEGDELHLTSLYTGRTIPGGHAWHSGVMGLIYIYAAAAPLPKMICMDRLHELCGGPPYATQQKCLDCATQHRKDLVAAKCQDNWVGEECAKTQSGGNIPMPDEVHGMHMEAHQTIDYKENVTFSGPAGAWFAWGYSLQNGTNKMKDSPAWVYCNNDDNTPVLQKRYLGDHNAGRIINNNLPCNVSTIDGTTSISYFYIGSQNIFGSSNDIYYLFAQGPPGEMNFSYHGSSRGVTHLSDTS